MVLVLLEGHLWCGADHCLWCGTDHCVGYGVRRISSARRCLTSPFDPVIMIT
jgi:hypothetical protein